MTDLEWISEKEFTCGGVSFLCALDDYTLKTNDERVIILKSREVLDNYVTVFGSEQPHNILEFGIFQGGSPTLLSLMFDVNKFVGVDICKPVVNFEQVLKRLVVGRKIRTYYEVSQADREKVRDIISTEFGNTAIDAIIDDASHEYELSKATFEIAFPVLAPGGTYILEDWGWPHWPGSNFFLGKTALSILLFQLIMLCASRQDIISEVRVFPSFAFIKKGDNPPCLDGMCLDDLYQVRGMRLLPDPDDRS